MKTSSQNKTFRQCEASAAPPVRQQLPVESVFGGNVSASCLQLPVLQHHEEDDDSFEDAVINPCLSSGSTGCQGLCCGHFSQGTRIKLHDDSPGSAAAP